MACRTPMQQCWSCDAVRRSMGTLSTVASTRPSRRSAVRVALHKSWAMVTKRRRAGTVRGKNALQELGRLVPVGLEPAQSRAATAADRRGARPRRSSATFRSGTKAYSALHSLARGCVQRRAGLTGAARARAGAPPRSGAATRRCTCWRRTLRSPLTPRLTGARSAEQV